MMIHQKEKIPKYLIIQVYYVTRFDYIKLLFFIIFLLRFNSYKFWIKYLFESLMGFMLLLKKYTF